MLLAYLMNNETLANLSREIEDLQELLIITSGLFLLGLALLVLLFIRKKRKSREKKEAVIQETEVLEVPIVDLKEETIVAVDELLAENEIQSDAPVVSSGPVEVLLNKDEVAEKVEDALKSAKSKEENLAVIENFLAGLKKQSVSVEDNTVSSEIHLEDPAVSPEVLSESGETPSSEVPFALSGTISVVEDLALKEEGGSGLLVGHESMDPVALASELEEVTPLVEVSETIREALYLSKEEDRLPEEKGRSKETAPRSFSEWLRSM
jgi:hypothetical protein